MKFLFAFAFLCLPATLLAQAKQGHARLDSLLAEVPRMQEDTNGVKLMNNISRMYNPINPDEGLKWAEKELALAQKLEWQLGEVYAYNDMGLNYQFKGAYPAALDAFFKTLRIDEVLGDKERIGAVSGNIGIVYWRQKEYPKALEWLFKALKIAEEWGDKKRMLTALGSIGSVYQEQGKRKDALAYMLKSLRMAEALNDKRSIVLQNTNIGNTYISLKQYNAALAYSFKALRIAEEMGDKQSIAINIGNAGEAYYLIAKDSIAPKPDNLISVSRAANLAKAIEYLNKGIAASREAQFLEAIPEFSQYLSEAFALQGNYKGALAAFKEATEVHDSLYNTANNEAIAKLETKRAVELKDKDILIARLKKRNERILSISGFAGLLLIMGILFRSYRRQQHSNILLSKEKKRSDDLLLNILPAEVAEELKDNGASAAKQYEEVSVLFTDFVNFTGTAETLSPQALVKELHECFSAFDAIIERNGLEKIKTIGDAYMAVCGLPLSDPRHAQRTVQAALEIRDFIAQRNGLPPAPSEGGGGISDFKSEGVSAVTLPLRGRAGDGAEQRTTFAIRIGVNSGPVVAGIVGVKKFAYDIWGDTVNTAARMESASEPGAVNISQSTYELVKEEYRCTPRGKVSAKGKGEVEMYFVAQSTAS